jgi:signal transduction histidine kinase
LTHEVARAFRRFAAKPDESALVEAYELGRTALVCGFGVLEMAHILSRALASTDEHRGDEDGQLDAAGGAERFFVEALSPFEMAHRGFREANTVLRRMNDMLEAQSSRIASALHDEAAQLLTPLHLSVAEAERHVSPEAGHALREMRGLLNALEERLRDLSHELRPPMLDHMGLVPTLESLVEGISKRWGVPVSLHVSIGNGLPPSVETTLYRVVQEGLTNMARHSGAGAARVSLERRPRAIFCSVSDDGRGVAASDGDGGHHGGFGLAGISERVAALGGTVHFGPSPQGRGSALTLEIPLEN